MKTLITIILFAFNLTAPTFADDIDVDINVNKDGHYKNYEISTKVEENVYKATVFVPTKTRTRAILLVSPTIVGVSSVEIALGQYFSKNGFLVVVTHMFATELMNPRPNMDKIDSDYMKPAIAAISFINHVDHQFKLPANLPVFAIGGSYGGISTVIITSHVPRIKAAWFAVGGGDLPYIYAHSTVKEIEKFRLNHMAQLGIESADQYESYLRGYLKNDPSISCKNITVPFHQTIALRDDSVPTKTQELLVRECPPHQVIRLPITHSSGTLTNVTMRKDVLEFFLAAI